MSTKHQKLWRMWLAFYLLWTAAAAVWLYNDGKHALHTLFESTHLNVDNGVAACDTMNQLAAQQGQDKKLMEIYLNIYQKNKTDNVLEQTKAYEALDVYFIAERATTGSSPHLKDRVHRILRDCATARFEITEAKTQRNAATRKLWSYLGIALLPPFVLLLIGTVFVCIQSRFESIKPTSP